MSLSERTHTLVEQWVEHGISDDQSTLRHAPVVLGRLLDAYEEAWAIIDELTGDGCEVADQLRIWKGEGERRRRAERRRDRAVEALEAVLSDVVGLTAADLSSKPEIRDGSWEAKVLDVLAGPGPDTAPQWDTSCRARR